MNAPMLSSRSEALGGRRAVPPRDGSILALRQGFSALYSVG